jgi:dGTPase
MENVNDVRLAGGATAGFSAGLAEAERGLKAFMYDKLYHHPQQLATAARARGVTADIYAALAQDPELMEASWLARLPNLEPARSRHIADYIAGMTDRFALALYRRVYGKEIEGLRNV